MNIYVIIIILSIYLFIQVFPIKEQKKNKIFINTSFIILFIILIIREPISDMQNYLSYLSFLRKANYEQFLNFNLEFMYKLLNVVIAKIWFNERFFICVIDTITTLEVYFFIKKYSKNYLITILLFVAIGTYYMQFFILRQAIAVAILLYSIRYIKSKRIFKFTLCVLIATLFHKTSLVFLLAYFVCNIKFNLKYLTLWIGIWATTFMFKGIINNISIRYVYQKYSKMQTAGEGYGRLIIFIGILFLTVIIDYFIKRKSNSNKEKLISIREEDDEISIFYNLTLLTILFQILTTQNDFFSRVANIFCIGPVILLPNMISQLKMKQNKQIISLLTIVCIIIYTIFKPSIIGYLTIF